MGVDRRVALASLPASGKEEARGINTTISFLLPFEWLLVPFIGQTQAESRRQSVQVSLLVTEHGGEGWKTYLEEIQHHI